MVSPLILRSFCVYVYGYPCEENEEEEDVYIEKEEGEERGWVGL